MLLLRHVLTIFSYNVTAEELFDLFGKFGPIRYAFDIRVALTNLSAGQFEAL